MTDSNYGKIIVHKIEYLNYDTNTKKQINNVNNKKNKNKDKNEENFDKIFNSELKKIT